MIPIQTLKYFYLKLLFSKEAKFTVIPTIIICDCFIPCQAYYHICLFSILAPCFLIFHESNKVVELPILLWIYCYFYINDCICSFRVFLFVFAAWIFWLRWFHFFFYLVAIAVECQFYWFFDMALLFIFLFYCTG